MTDLPDLVRYALAAAARGWRIFPLVPDDKRPAVRAWEERATTDPARITHCWQAGSHGIGIACGPSRLMVLDLDVPKHPGETPPPEWAEPGVHDGADVLAVLCERYGQPFPCETYITQTGRGGLHLYFQAPIGVELRNTAGRLGWLIDTRATGGYVLAAGSTVNGRPYTVVHEAEPAPLPTWLLRLLTAEPARPSTGIGAVLTDLARPAGYAGAALRGEVQQVLDSRPGQRNATLNQAAYALGRLVGSGVLPSELAFEALRRAGQAAGLSPREATATVNSGLRAGMRRPRGGTA